MLATQQLGGYLDDHLAGATTAIDLARETRRWAGASRVAEGLSVLIREIEDDRESLIAVMDHLELSSTRLKRILGRLAERLSRLKFADPLRTREVNRLLQVESLLMGIQGKRAMWETLELAADAEPRLNDFDLPALVARADHQLARLNTIRLDLVDAL
jgi:hypothetical protein